MEILTKVNCKADVNVYDIELTGQYVILKPEFFKEEYRQAKYQLVKCGGGFGCTPGKLGNAIFVKEMQKDNPESYRIERCNREILGVANEETIAQFKAEYGWNEEE